MTKKILSILAAGLVATGTAFSQDAAGVAMTFAARPVDAVSYSLGGVTAFHSAAARLYGKSDLSLSYASFKTSATKSTDLGADLFLKLGSRFAIGVTYFGETGESVDLYEVPGVVSGTFKPKNTAIGGSLAYRFADAFALGVSVRSLKTKLTSSNDISAVGIDVMASGNISGFKYAAGVTNLGGKVEGASGEKYPIPGAFSAALRRAFALSGNHSIEANLQGDIFFKGGLRLGAGVQYSYGGWAFVRAGYSHGGDTVLPSYPSVGLGCNIGKHFSIDATTLLGDLSGTTVAGLKWIF